MSKTFFHVLGMLILLSFASAWSEENQPARRYEPNWESIDRRPMPAWFNEAKFGIFIVWGVYSVPSYVDEGYAEWYGWRMYETGSPTWKFHQKVYPNITKYEQFAEQFRAELWDPDFWADIIVRSGAKYVVTTANFHDGFAMWPTHYSKTINTDQWNSMVAGPKRDLLGELNEAGNKRSLKMGIYYSLYEWWHPLWQTDRDRYVTEHLHPKFKEVVTKYKPPVIFLDGEWEMDYKKWRSEELAAWLYNDSPVADEVVVNDRWGQCRSEHGSYYSSEYGGGEYPPTHPWEEDQGIGKSYGYNRNESIFDYDSADGLIRMLSKVCGNGGNLLLDIGPTGDGRIPVIMQERLLQIGDWLKVNGEAIYGSKANPFWPRRFSWGTCTTKPGRLYLHIHDKNQKEISLRGLQSPIRAAYLLADADKKPLTVNPIDGGVKISLPENSLQQAVSIAVLETGNELHVDNTPEQDEDGTVFLHCYAMKIHGSKAKLQINGYSRMVHIGEWSDPGEWISCDFNLRTPGAFEVEAIYSSDEKSSGTQFEISIGDRTLLGKTENTVSWNEYKTLPLGRITLAKAGNYTITIKPQSPETWKNMAIQSITLKPVK